MPFIRAEDKPAEEPRKQPSQELLPAEGDNGRDEKGRFKPGVSGNPNGGLPSGWQYFPTRAAYLLEKYKSTRELMEVVQDREKLGELPPRDAQILMRIAKTLTSKGDSTYWSFLDRMEGKRGIEQGNQIGNVGNLTVQQIFVGELPRGIVET